MNLNYFLFKWHLSLIVLLGMTHFLNAQLSADLPLQSESPRIQALLTTEVPVTTLPEIDVSPYLEEDRENEDKNIGWRFAVSIPVDLSMENSGQWEKLPNGDRIWRLHIRSENAVSNNLLYKEFYLPKSATLHLYKPDKSQVLGAFTSLNNKEDRVFATALLMGESVVLEYYEPQNVKGEGVIHIGTFNHGYRGYGENNAAAGNSGPCQNDVNCSNDPTWQTIKRAVGKWTRNGNTWCSGTLMNNTNEDCRPLFLTANHCMDALTGLDYDAVNNPGPFNTAIFYWNFETPGCNVSPQQDGDDSQTTNGIKLVVANPDLDGNYSSSSDFALFELDENPKSAYNVYFAGWDATGNTGTGGAGIHHPAGDVKKISIHSLTPASAVSDRYWRINPWDEVFGNRGVTEGGSSGSGLFRSNGRLLGQLFGSFSTNENCNDPLNDTGDYGKLSYSWTNNGAADSRRRLNAHFDPLGSGVITVMNGSFNPCGIPSNVVCENALNINCGGSRTVNTMSSTSDGNPGPGNCGVALIENQKGVWYKYTGTGEHVTVSTCSNFTDFDTKLSIFSGTCDGLICIGGNDDAPGCGTKSEVDFVSTPGTAYYIFLAGFGGATGNAEVSISCCDLPLAVCQDIIVNLDALGSDINISPSDVASGSVADCGLASETVSPNSFDCMDIGPNLVTYTITDVNGNQSTCTAIVTVEDEIDPSITCPSSLTIECHESIEPGNTGFATGDDNCTENPLITYNDVANLNGCGGYTGTITRTWTATDPSGNFVTCDQVITIVDNTPPIPVCQDITVQLGDNEEVSITANQIDNGSFDACGSVSLSIDVSTFSCYFLGNHSVTLTVTDECGNISSCTATVSVEGPDEDCDSVSDICDECPGGDDTIDNNNDGLPDCAYYPGFDNLIEDWKCGKNNQKVLVCHIPINNTGNPQTTCISPSAIPAHLAHGDYLGPCGDANCGNAEALASNPTHFNYEGLSLNVSPNPFQHSTNISFHLENEGFVHLEIYDLNGQLINQLLSGTVSPGTHNLKWYSDSNSAIKQPSGIYFVILKTDEQVITKKVNLME